MLPTIPSIGGVPKAILDPRDANASTLKMRRHSATRYSERVGAFEESRIVSWWRKRRSLQQQVVAMVESVFRLASSAIATTSFVPARLAVWGISLLQGPVGGVIVTTTENHHERHKSLITPATLPHWQDFQATIASQASSLDGLIRLVNHFPTRQSRCHLPGPPPHGISQNTGGHVKNRIAICRSTAPARPLLPEQSSPLQLDTSCDCMSRCDWWMKLSSPGAGCQTAGTSPALLEPYPNSLGCSLSSMEAWTTGPHASSQPPSRSVPSGHWHGTSGSLCLLPHLDRHGLPLIARRASPRLRPSSSSCSSGSHIELIDRN